MRSFRTVSAVVGTYLLAGASGYAAHLASAPLAWVIGAMLATAALTVTTLAPPLPAYGRNLGQFFLGIAIGLWFTPEAAVEASRHMGAMALAAAGTLATGSTLALLHAKMAKSDVITAFLSSVPGGPAEMAILARHYGAQGAPVAMAQTMRICALVLIIPPALTWAGSSGGELFSAPSLRFEPIGFAALVAAALAATALASRLRVVNAWFLAPTAVVASLTAFDIRPSSLPWPMLELCQIALGASLGAMFQRQLLKEARRFLAAAIVVTSLLIVAANAMALALGPLTGLPFSTLALSLAPGGLSEMSVTAQVLHLAVPVITAFHLMRIFLIVLLTPWLLAGLHWTMSRWRSRRNSV
jgi:membrane AbrB-like protein